MTKYKVGDMVRVRPDLKMNVYYGNYFATDDMAALRGAIVKIIEVIKDIYGNNAYHIDNSDWVWTDSMFEEERYDFPSKSDLMQLLEG